MQAQAVYHLFNLPPELIDTLTLRTLLSESPNSNSIPDEKPTQDGTDGTLVSSANTGARACNICLGVTFSDVDEQRSHFRSDWHRYNVKTRLSGGQSVSEDRFGQLVEALDDSLSGSASEDEDESSGGASSDAVNTLVNKTKRLNARLNPSEDDRQHQKRAPQSPFAWFHSSKYQTQLGVYRTLLPTYVEPDDYLQELKDMQRGGPEGRSWALFMVAGGHFAGAIVQVNKSDEEREEEDTLATTSGKKKKQKKPKPETEVLRHKTFHRYTTRKKQGGSQSVNDNAKGPAKSAGATLRRYGEQALQEDIRNLLLEWAEDIDSCERIWIRASVSNRRIFFDFDGPIVKGDDRLRTFPFPTRRPTQSELTRCLLELTRPKVSHLTEEELREQDEAYLASIKPKLPKPTDIPTSQIPAQPAPSLKPKLTKEEEVLKDKWFRALDMVSRDRLEALKSFLEREESVFGDINALVPDSSMRRAGTLLQAATLVGSEDTVKWLLEDKNADPTIPIPLSTHSKDVEAEAEQVPLKPGTKRTAYDLAKTKVIRDIFRRCAATYPDKWDWLGAARVPSELSKEMEQEQEEKKKVRRKGLKDKVKEREREAAAKKATTTAIDPEPEPKPVVSKRENPAGPRKLGGTTGAVEGVAGLSPEMRAKVERERRARAAEARLKSLSKS
ncbi:hypothetical protein AGABI1DRAFT_118975 [Agaricus bisporus var. burnettii JB137-S8]|uniref:VLRF1 domain-containing protein n=1 Tax=Agaricus bisporus var. burnettii (strain JB137-S8 / ATCC MYA-4627 / FGSC 10392) TaxID=597362 RepID=K5XFD2_AGABU|nr:uncharacterized protein AGABI1DRAFT_118975 [Agaricus bisporus var. burnettii JB137-S8]EKM81942.1 hypothetical protein AGABI1DRAFT_118975 [Agaricus bisporus var. burnettii JB137-S8]